jgi:hypothetical protein
VEPSKHVRYFVTNHQNQPLELHLSGSVVVLPSRQEKEISEGDLKNAQLKVFRKQLLVSVREAAEPAEQAPEEAAAEESSEEVSPTERPGGVKRRGTSKKEG